MSEFVVTNIVWPVMFKDWDLDLADVCAARRQYRTLRIAIYAPQSSDHGRNGMYQGSCGMSREEARKFIYDYYYELSWRTYMGSK